MKTTQTLAVLRSFFSLMAAVVIVITLSITSAFAQTPPAGTLIGNQATATFNDAGGNPRTVTSNVVNTQVAQVAALTLSAPQTRTVAAGGQLAFPHTITNNGNGTDRFDLTSAQSGDYAFSTISFYEDLDGNGVPDNFNPITVSPNLAAGTSFNFVAVVTVPASALDGESATLTVTATSQFNNTVVANNADVADISDNAVINITKAMSSSTGDPGSGPYTVTLTYTNSGNATGTNLAISDALPVNMDYVAGTGRWSVTGSSALTDDGTAEPSVNIDYSYTAGTRTVAATVASIAPGQSGTVTFQVNIAAATPPGTLNNTATYSYNDGAGNVGPFNSNTYIFTVNPSPGVTGTGETIASANQGVTVTFTNQITNTGNITDVFNITIQSNSFPVGSSYILYKSDGLSPLLDTNGDGIPDSGPLAAAATYNIVLKVTLPNGANGGGPYTITKRATSVTDPSVFDDMDDVLTTIAGNTVDITANNDIANDGAQASDGLGAGPEGSPIQTNSTNPGTTTRYTLFVNNTSAVSDNYDLSVSTDQTFATQTIPVGVTVTFRDAATLAVIANTGTVLANSEKEIFVDITIPSNKAATSTPESYFVRSVSPASGANDRIHLGLTVNTIRDMALTPNNSGQVFPGGAVTYIHTITNNGNTVENASGTAFSISVSNSNGSFSAVAYIDINEDGSIDGGDVQINGSTNFGSFAIGQSKQIIVRVNATPGVTEGLINTTTVTATLVGNVNGVVPPTITSATDVTTVINSNVTLVKKQAKDANNDGTPDAGAGVYVTTQVTANPGEGILYQITVSNLGTTAVTTVQINDAIPAYTTYNVGVAPVATSKGTASYNAGTNTITVDVGSLGAGESAVITFGVLIDN